MRRDIAKLLETGPEATARIRVEHIFREENMMAAQEIIELFCELIVVRLPIIETQKDCPLDMKEAISTICFAAPRCSDLPELQQIQMLFASKYGKEFVAAASELMPDCGVNRQLRSLHIRVIELLSVRAPTAETKLKLLKEIAVEQELDWNPAVTETEFFKSHEDLLNVPTMFIDGSKLPLPEEKHTVPVVSAPASTDETDLDLTLDSLDLPQVTSIPVKLSSGSVQKPELGIPQSPNSFATEAVELTKHENSGSILDDYISNSQADKQEESIHCASEEKLFSHLQSSVSVESKDRQFLPFMSPPTSCSPSISIGENEHSQAISSTSRIMTDAPLALQDVLAAARNAAVTAERAATSQSISSTAKITTDAHVDLQDVLAAAWNAAESAERAAAAAHSAASLAEVRIFEIIKKRNSLPSEDSGSGGYEASESNDTLDADHPTIFNGATFDANQSFANRIDAPYSPEEAANQDQLCPKLSPSDLPKVGHEVGSHSGEHMMENSSS